LPDAHFSSHIQQPHIRLLQRIVHSFLLPFLDGRRPKWTLDEYPQRIPAEIARELARELGQSKTIQPELSRIGQP
jgi:hypothetical protein